MAKKKTQYKVTYSGTRHFDTFSTKKAAVDQAKYAVGIGNMKSCVFRRLPGGSWYPVGCKQRRRR